MAILIEGMEMPKNCDSCRIMEFEDTNCVNEFYCGCPIVFQAHPQGVDHRPDYCPLIEVPEPHGRLIDKDALDIYQRAEAAYAEYQEDEDNLYLEGMANGLCEAAKQLSVARTIIPANEEG